MKWRVVLWDGHLSLWNQVLSLQVDSVRIEVNYREPCGCLWICCWCGGPTHTHVHTHTHVIIGAKEPQRTSHYDSISPVYVCL